MKDENNIKGNLIWSAICCQAEYDLTRNYTAKQTALAPLLDEGSEMYDAGADSLEHRASVQECRAEQNRLY